MTVVLILNTSWGTESEWCNKERVCLNTPLDGYGMEIFYEKLPWFPSLLYFTLITKMCLKSPLFSTASHFERTIDHSTIIITKDF